MAFTPTPQQDAIRQAVLTGETVVVDALAGAGKTSTALLVAQDHPRRQISYVAFNRPIADEASRRFPRNTTARTSHSFAFRSVMNERPALKARLDTGGFVPAWKQAQILRLPNDFQFGQFRMRDNKLATLVNEAVTRFCHSAEPEPQGWMVPKVPGLDTPEATDAFRVFLLPFVQRAWEDLKSDNGQLRFSHDCYLKIFSMSDYCRLPGDLILMDEAQDINPVTKLIVDKQAERGAQILVIGDTNQQIYAWRGAVDSLNMYDTPHRLPLTKSFRFGPEIADEANRILEWLDTPLRVEGHDPVYSTLGHLDAPDTVLTRTNAEAIGRLMEAQIAGTQTGLVGGTQAVEYLAKAALDLTEGRPTTHPDLIAFDNWNQVREYVEDASDAGQLKVLVKLVDTHGAEKLLDAVAQAVPEQQAHLLLSTAHKAKGREWDRVQIAGDFPSPEEFEDGVMPAEELRLAYVAVTRAKEVLDSSALSWLMDADRVFLEAAEVPEKAPRITVQVAQVMVDPECEYRVIMQGTKYDENLVKAQKALRSDMRPSFRGEYAGFQKVRIVNANADVLRIVQQFGLTITDEARQRIEDYS